jgi:ABC-2 type transport system permease protein
MPVKDSEVILGKYVAAVLMCVVLLVCSLLYPVAMFVAPWHLGALDWGPVFAGYLGLFLFCCAGCALGLMFSSLTDSQIIAFFLSAAALLILLVIGQLAEFVHGAFGDTLSFISMSTEYAGFARGLINTRAVIYFVSIAVVCLLFSFRSLESRKWA